MTYGCSLLAVNFDPALVRLLREVKYFVPMDKDVPKSALELHGKAETFRVQAATLRHGGCNPTP